MKPIANNVWSTGLTRLGPSEDTGPGRPAPGIDREKFAEATGLGIVTTDSVGTITSWNAAAERMFGFTREDAVGRSIQIIIPGRFHEAHSAGMKRVASGWPSRLLGQNIEIVACKSDGTEFPIGMSLASWTSENGVEFGAHMIDISERRTAEERLEHRASHDQLTRLLAQHTFMSRLQSAIEQGRRMALIMIDLDGFKAVNDSLGHAVGDGLLQALAVRLKAIADPSWLIGRMGGDEFAIALETDDESSTIARASSKIMDRIGKTFEVAGHKLHVFASIGIALTPDDAADAEELLELADRAMFQAKRRGGDAVERFDRAMKEEVAERRSLNEGLRAAQREMQWELLYQPQFDLRTDRLIGAEALLRWNHPERGLIEPAAFLPVLENHLIAYEVGQWVLEESCRQLAAWRSDGLVLPRISCNLFAAQLHALSFREDLFRILDRHGLTPGDVKLEITEKIALEIDRGSLRPLFELAECGVGVALDDFGTGYASLATLTRAPITQLKIDRGFVDRITEEPHCSAVIAGMVAISEALKVSLIAEGVETHAQARKLRQLGCHTVQGFLFGKPMTGVEFARINRDGPTFRPMVTDAS